MKYKYVGKLKEKIAKKCGISEYKNKPIIVYEDRIDHVILRHLNDFGDKEKILYIYKK